jgi:hypothetical protein
MTGEGPRLKKILYELDLPAGQWVLSGSGVLVLNGIERDRPMGDVDIFVATRTWFTLFFRDLMSYERNPWGIFTTEPNDKKRRSDPPYLFKQIHGIEVNIFQSWRRRGIGDIDVAFWLANPQIVEGFPCVPVQFLLDWKEEVGRAKDQTDIERIREWLQRKT